MRRKHKYNARPTVVDGIRFASKKEANRYGELKLLLQAGVITDLRWQAPYTLTVNGITIAKYYADFVYTENGTEVVEDVKGYRTGIYKLKRNLMLAVHGITIQEV